MARKRLFFLSVLVLAALPVCNARPRSTDSPATGPLDREKTRWAPYLEWSLENSTVSGNPFDLVATVTFSHAGGSTRITEMFYAGGDDVYVAALPEARGAQQDTPQGKSGLERSAAAEVTPPVRLPGRARSSTGEDPPAGGQAKPAGSSP